MPNPPYTMADLASFGYIKNPSATGTSLSIGPDAQPRWWRSGDTFNVMDYGAAGDGIVDDTIAIQDTIDACIAGGSGTVFLPAGTYLVTSTLSFAGMSGTWKGLTFKGVGSAAHVSLGLYGAGATRIVNASGGTCLSAYSTSSGSFINALQLEGFNITNTVALAAAVYTIDCSAIISGLGMRDVVVQGGNLQGNGICFALTNGNWLFERVRVYDLPGVAGAGGTGILLSDGTNPLGGYLRADHWTSMGSMGNTISCVAQQCFIGFNYYGDLTGFAASGCSAINTSEVSGSTGFNVGHVTGGSWAGCYSEGHEIGVNVSSVATGCHIHIMSGAGYTPAAAKPVVCSGDNNHILCTIVSGIGTVPDGVVISAGAVGNSIWAQPRLSGAGTITTLYGDHAVGGENHFGPSLAEGDIYTDGTFPTPSDRRVASALAVKTYVDKRIMAATANASVTITATAAATATSILALPNANYQNRLIRIEFSVALLRINPATAGNSAILDFWLDDGAGTDLGYTGEVTGTVVGRYSTASGTWWIELTPAAGAHIYSIRGWKTAAGDTAEAITGAGYGSGNYADMKLTATYV